MKSAQDTEMEEKKPYLFGYRKNENQMEMTHYFTDEVHIHSRKE